ncbi:hypothetical protein MMYC01_204145 [Madurella mycetomatis]|uniref:DUF7732 domain-containing protein n=1 Tax=Madurella mycetomatis TaxID=100816 RepID=A0A175W908_9PEZI|nr:hypothetical protein MMYC01_204145 [Madurella mycetomatis]
MRFSLALLATLVADATVHAVVAPPAAEVAQHQPLQNAQRDEASSEELWKRRGGGGGGGRGGGGGGGGSRGGGSSSSSFRAGTGPPRSYGGGQYYGGGSTQPYRSGSRSPGGIAPVFFGAAFLAFWPGVWLYGAHLYYHPRPYTFYNETSQENETKPVICACDPQNMCGCDNGTTAYMNDLIGDGRYTTLNHSLVTVADVNGSSTILINGTLPNGTTAPSGGTGPSGGTAPSGGESVAGTGLQALLEGLGWWPVVAAVGAIVFAA